MIKIRKSDSRGHADHGWLKTSYTFSFADYHDPAHMHFRSLRVINEDWVAPGKGFGEHPHNDMEILTYVISGELEHKDSMGNGRVIKAGELQYMSAGTGVTHSEFNPSKTEPVHLLQVWILPDEKNLKPSYAEWKPEGKVFDNKLTLLVSKSGADGSIKIHQDASLYLVELRASDNLNYPTPENRHLWVQVIEGNVNLNEQQLHPGDGAAVYLETALAMQAETDTKFLLFDLA